MYKWFVWSSGLMRYVPLEGLYPFSRASCHPRAINPSGLPAPICFSIPMFNRHNPAYFE